MTLLNEILQNKSSFENKSITFNIDLFDQVDKNIKIAEKLGATNIEKYKVGTADNKKGFKLTVKNKTLGKKILDIIYDLNNVSNDKKEQFYKRLK